MCTRARVCVWFIRLLGAHTCKPHARGFVYDTRGRVTSGRILIKPPRFNHPFCCFWRRCRRIGNGSNRPFSSRDHVRRLVFCFYTRGTTVVTIKYNIKIIIFVPSHRRVIVGYALIAWYVSWKRTKNDRKTTIISY